MSQLPTSAEKAERIIQIEGQITVAQAALDQAQQNLAALLVELATVQGWETFDEPPPLPLVAPSAPEGLSLDPYGLRWERQQYEGVPVTGYEVNFFDAVGNGGIVDGTLIPSNDGLYMFFQNLSNNYVPALHTIKVRATPVTLPDSRVSPVGHWSELGPQTA